MLRSSHSTHLTTQGLSWSGGKDLALEGYQEHHVADLLIKELHDLAKDDERWGAKFKVLKENLEHHIDEEEGPMFRTARGLFSREELQALGAQMMKMQAEINDKWLKGLKDADKNKVTCGTCHRGKDTPPPFVPAK